MSTTDTIAITADLGPSTSTWYSETTSHVANAAPTATPRRRDPRVVAAVSDLIHSYHRPAYIADENGEILCMNAAAGRLLDEPDDESVRLEAAATLKIGDRSFQLFVPAPEETEEEVALGETHLPPRLARIARLVVSGC
ncbi:MAG: hypothetical protein KC420_01375, partial [Myxococcales bacterium]|nr:hypothetical protein [Myxococcales bacterium]